MSGGLLKEQGDFYHESAGLFLACMPAPKRPRQLSDYAARTLEALAAEGLGHRISLGGALGLLHYLDYRATHDVDAWWAPSATASERERVLRTVEASLQPLGDGLTFL